jgi:predicted metalloprotease
LLEKKRLGASKAEFSQAYVIAHEVGHHFQNLLGRARRCVGRLVIASRQSDS